MIHAQSEMKWFEAWIYRTQAYHYEIYSWMLHVCKIHVYVNGSYTHQTERAMLVLHPFMQCTRVHKSIIHSSDGKSDARSTSIHTMCIPSIHAKVACIYATHPNSITQKDAKSAFMDWMHKRLLEWHVFMPCIQICKERIFAQHHTKRCQICMQGLNA